MNRSDGTGKPTITPRAPACLSIFGHKRSLSLHSPFFNRPPSPVWPRPPSLSLFSPHILLLCASYRQNQPPKNPVTYIFAFYPPKWHPLLANPHSPLTNPTLTTKPPRLSRVCANPSLRTPMHGPLRTTCAYRLVSRCLSADHIHQIQQLHWRGLFQARGACWRLGTQLGYWSHAPKHGRRFGRRLG